MHYFLSDPKSGTRESKLFERFEAQSQGLISKVGPGTQDPGPLFYVGTNLRDPKSLSRTRDLETLIIGWSQDPEQSSQST